MSVSLSSRQTAQDNKIVTAHQTLTADRIPIAVHGSKTECGCKLIGKVNATVG